MRLTLNALKVCTAIACLSLTGMTIAADTVENIEERYADRHTRVYEVADIVAKLMAMEPGHRAQAANDAKKAIESLVRGADPKPISKPIVFKWFGGNLVVTGTEKQHRLVTTAFSNWRRNGLREVAIEVQMIEAPTNMLQNINGRWIVKDVSEQAGLSKDREMRNFDAPSGTLTTRSNLPVLLHTVPREAAERLAEQLVKEKGVSSSQVAPRLLNDQVTLVTRATQRPFVIGFEANGQSIVRVVTAGLQLKLRAQVKGDSIQLLSEIRYSQVKNVLSQQLGTTLTGAPRMVQVPEVVTAKVQTAVDLRNDQCHLVGGIPVESKDGKERSMLLLITARERRK